jgi:hypothetical protein
MAARREDRINMTAYQAFVNIIFIQTFVAGEAWNSSEMIFLRLGARG